MPLLIDVEGHGDFVPTLYAVWRVPQLCSHVTIPAPVSAFVLKGADLMLPGLCPEASGEYAQFAKGDVRTVLASGNPTPIAVGLMCVGSEEAFAGGMKGQAMRCISVFTDELWTFGGSEIPNAGFGLKEVTAYGGPAGGKAEAKKKKKKSKKKDDEDIGDSETEDERRERKERKAAKKAAKVASAAEQVAGAPAPQTTPADMDALLQHCFIASFATIDDRCSARLAPSTSCAPY